MKKIILFFLVFSSIICKVQTSQAVFEKQIIELLKYSDNDFKDIKGKAIPGTSDEFTSTYKLNGAAKNVIWQIGWTSFIATFPATKDSSEAYATFKKMEESIRKMLGDKATAKFFEEEKQITSSTSAKLTTIKFLKDDGDLSSYFVDLELEKTTRKLEILKTINIEWSIKITIYHGL